MERFSYVAVLLFCLLGTGWLEIALRTRVYRRWLRLTLTVLAVVPFFVVWDLYAIKSGHWWFDVDRITGVFLFSILPLDELLFFITIPVVSVLTYEAVRAVKSWWPAGDEQ